MLWADADGGGTRTAARPAAAGGWVFAGHGLPATTGMAQVEVGGRGWWWIPREMGRRPCWHAVHHICSSPSCFCCFVVVGDTAHVTSATFPHRLPSSRRLALIYGVRVGCALVPSQHSPKAGGRAGARAGGVGGWGVGESSVRSYFGIPKGGRSKTQQHGPALDRAAKPWLRQLLRLLSPTNDAVPHLCSAANA